jgi:hypothetical protein
MEMNLNYDGDDKLWYLNYEVIASSTNICPTIRLLAIDLQKNPYISIGDWVQSLSDNSFAEIYELASTDDEDSFEMEQMLLLTLMLSHAEGTSLPNDDMEGMNRQLAVLRQLIVMCSLEKKGFVRCHYENFTLGEDMGDRIVVERL